MYSIIMLACAVLFGIFAVLIYRGKTDLIHDYHQKNVKDKAAYGKAFGKTMAAMAATMVISGILAFFWVKVSIIALFAGFAVSFALMYRVQKKYNGGVFS